MDLIFRFKFLAVQMFEHHGIPHVFEGGEKKHFIFHELYTLPGHSPLELASGEVLFTPEHERSPFEAYDKEPIWADLYYIENGEASGESRMEYYDTLGSVRSFIRICIYAPRSQFEDLLANVRSGLVPTSIDVKFAEGPQYWKKSDPEQRHSKTVWKHEGYITEQFKPAEVPVEGHAFCYTIQVDDKSLKRLALL